MKNILIHLKLLAVAAIWGLAWVAGRIIALEIPPITAAWMRYVIAVALFLVYLRLTNKWILPTKEQWKLITLIGLFSTFVYQAFFMYGMKYTAAGDASLMITFNPLFTALLAIPFLGEKMDLRLGSGLLLALSGVGVLFFYSPNVDIPFSTRLIGDLFIAGAALSWAASSILMKKAMTTEHQPLSPLHLTVWSAVVGLLIMTPWAGYEVLQHGIPNPSDDVWISIIFLAILSTVVSYVWFADGIKTIGASKSSLYVYLVPPFGIISGWLLIDEMLGWSFLASFVLIVGGVILAQTKESS